MKPKSVIGEVKEYTLTPEELEKYHNLPKLTDQYGKPLKQGMVMYMGGFKH